MHLCAAGHVVVREWRPHGGRVALVLCDCGRDMWVDWFCFFVSVVEKGGGGPFLSLLRQWRSVAVAVMVSVVVLGRGRGRGGNVSEMDILKVVVVVVAE